MLVYVVYNVLKPLLRSTVHKNNCFLNLTVFGTREITQLSADFTCGRPSFGSIVHQHQQELPPQSRRVPKHCLLWLFLGKTQSIIIFDGKPGHKSTLMEVYIEKNILLVKLIYLFCSSQIKNFQVFLLQKICSTKSYFLGK